RSLHTRFSRDWSSDVALPIFLLVHALLPCSCQPWWCRAGRAPLRTAGHTPLEPLAALAVTGTTHANCEPHAQERGQPQRERPSQIGRASCRERGYESGEVGGW